MKRVENNGDWDKKQRHRRQRVSSWLEIISSIYIAGKARQTNTWNMDKSAVFSRT